MWFLVLYLYLYLYFVIFRIFSNLLNTRRMNRAFDFVSKRQNLIFSISLSFAPKNDQISIFLPILKFSLILYLKGKNLFCRRMFYFGFKPTTSTSNYPCFLSLLDNDTAFFRLPLKGSRVCT